MTAKAIKLARQTLDLYDRKTAESNSKIKQLEDQILVLKAQLNVSNRLLAVSEDKRQQLLKVLDTNKY